ncbi:MAG: hypothetical protein JWM32_3048 [Verrucomicrobia bacterium]|nr:hypothetical protein [Verrucomicrobiota bacterium]
MIAHSILSIPAHPRMKPVLYTLLLFLGTWLAGARASTATITPNSTSLVPAGGVVILTASVAGHPGTTTGIAFEVTLPAGWAYVSGANEPGVKPQAGDTGTLGWAYFSIPGTASFTFTVSYPANIVTSQSITSVVTIANGAANETVTPTAVTLSPAVVPVVNNTGTISATFGSTVSTQISATSSIAIIGYDAVGLPSGLGVDLVSGLISGTPTQTGTFPVTLKATNAAGIGTANITFTVASGNASIVLSTLTHSYDGNGHAATATTTPSGLTVVITYDGGSAVPANAGSYAVVATVNSGGYTATASGTLVIARTVQTISFSPVGTLTPNQSAVLSATASSGLPVTFALQSGSATLSGATLTINGSGSVVVRATQAGSANYNATFADQTINSSKLSQSISFAPPADHLAIDPPFSLSVSASSGLPVALTVVSGPALLSGNTVTLTGAGGTVVVRADQAGDGTYEAAVPVTHSFLVGAESDRVFFGGIFMEVGAGPVGIRSTSEVGGRLARTSVNVGDIAAVVPAGGNTGYILVVAPDAGISGLIEFTLGLDGTFVTNIPQTTAGATHSLVLRGRLAANILSGTIDEIGGTFSMPVEFAGPAAASAGLYRSSSLSTAQGVTYVIVGTDGVALVLTVTPTLTVGGRTSLQGDGSFQLTARPAGSTESVTIRGVVDSSATTVAGTITAGSAAPVAFAGLKATTARTDRLVNLSSRGRVGAGERLLITGFVIGGTQSKQVLIRAIGPALANFGVSGGLADPKIRLYRMGVLVAENDDWGSGGNDTEIAAIAGRIGAFSLTRGSKDAILTATLTPGSYSAQVSGGNGVALAELYDAAENPSSEDQRLVNISSRGEVGEGENILIGGFVVTGNSPKKVLIRGIGPALAAYGVGSPLADPVLKVYQGGGLIAENDDWSSDAATAPAVVAAAASTGAFPLVAGSKDSAFILTLAPGVYSVQVAGKGASVGVALMEIYEMGE